jgi:hypothetical protein
MRTTLTIEDDVAAQIEQLQAKRPESLKSLINQLLRQGLKHLTTPPQPVAPYRTRTVALGRCLVGNVDDIAEALAVAEGENYR